MVGVEHLARDLADAERALELFGESALAHLASPGLGESVKFLAITGPISGRHVTRRAVSAVMPLLGPHVADFVPQEARLALEGDGGWHATACRDTCAEG